MTFSLEEFKSPSFIRKSSGQPRSDGKVFDGYLIRGSRVTESYKDPIKRSHNRLTACRKFRSNNRDKVRQYNKDYSINNTKKFRNYYKTYRENKKAKDPSFLIKACLYRRINGAVTDQRTTKSNKTVELIGCDIPTLIRYLESKFLPGMTWKNRGKNGWHIDHILPCSYFNLSDPIEQKKCFHYTNLQPLWARDNILKANKLPDEYILR